MGVVEIVFNGFCYSCSKVIQSCMGKSEKQRSHVRKCLVFAVCTSLIV